MSNGRSASTDILRVDPGRETERIVAGVRAIVFNQLKSTGTVVAVSGGMDSSVVAFLCARALGGIACSRCSNELVTWHTPLQGEYALALTSEATRSGPWSEGRSTARRAVRDFPTPHNHRQEND
jgi:NH3-dependent NAD+ synthetase